MRRLRTRRGGFTLIELMITVAIIGILAALAIPQFAMYQNRSKRSESMTNLNAIVKTEIAYFGANGVFWGAAPMPAGAPTPSKKVWDALSKAEYGGLGYSPEGGVLYAYEVNNVASDCACGVGTNGDALCFTATAYGDVDGDGAIGMVAYFYTDPGGLTCVTGIGANGPPTDPNTGNLILDRPTVLPVAVADDF
jgi:type IV pilus assembly protein PilA